MNNDNLITLLTIFIPLTGLAVLLQASVLLGVLLTVRRAIRMAKGETGEFRGKLDPVLDTSKELMETVKDLTAATKNLIGKLEPRLESTATHIEDIARNLHAQATQLQASVDEVAQRARHQADRVDGMATAVLDRFDRLGNVINDTVNVPLRQINGVVAAARAVVETLRGPAPQRPRASASAAPAPSPTPHEADKKDAKAELLYPAAVSTKLP